MKAGVTPGGVIIEAGDVLPFPDTEKSTICWQGKSAEIWGSKPSSSQSETGVGKGGPGDVLAITSRPACITQAPTQSQYERMAPHLPVQRGNVSVSNRQVLNAILYVAEHGCEWRGLPKRFGNWHTIYITRE